MKNQSSSPIVIIGFGNQAKAWALNLRDSGRKVVVALREGSSSGPLAKNLGFSVVDLGRTDLGSYDYFVLLTPDHTHFSLLKQIRPLVPAKATFILAHGFSWHKHQLKKEFPEWDFLLFAPKSIASELRFQYETRGTVGGVYSLENSSRPEEDFQFLTTLARDLGVNVGPFPTSFENETFADLFSEQSLLCSLVPYTALTCYNLLVEKGIEKELAYLECWHELKLIVDTMVKIGPEKFFHLISPNALLGSQKGKDLLLDPHFMGQMKRLLQDIFQKDFYAEIDGKDFEKVKKEVVEFWSRQDFSATHNKLSPLLYP